jgi:hypothetical protein
MSDCCTDFATTTASVDREPNPIWIAHDDCGYKAQYKGPVGTQFNRFMPVKPGAAPGELVPALNGVDAIGFADVTKLTTATDQEITVVRKAASVAWADVALAVGASAFNQAAWWAVHVQMAKIGIYVTF